MAQAKKKTTKKDKSEVVSEKPATEEEKLSRREKSEMSLYDCRLELAEIEALVEEDGELTDEQAARLVEIHSQSISKMKGIVYAIRHIGETCDIIDEEIKRLKALKDWRKTVQTRIENALLNHVLFVEPEKKKLDLDTYILAAQKCPASVNVIEGFDDPFLCRVSAIKNPSVQTIDAAMVNGDDIVRLPDKKAIKEAILAGDEIPGCELIDNKYTLKIK